MRHALLTAFAVFIGVYAGPLAASPLPVPATKLADPAHLFCQAFDLNADNPTVEFEFIPMTSGKHSAVAVWDGDAALQLRVGEGKPRTGKQGVLVEFAGKEGEPQAIVLRLAVGADAASGKLTVLYGAGQAASNRPFGPQPPGRVLPAAAMTETRDALLPIFCRLAERYLVDAPNPNEMDRVFAESVERNPGLTREYLRGVVQRYRALPDDVANERCVDPAPGRSLATPISRWDCVKALLEASPQAADTIDQASKQVSDGTLAAPAVIEQLEPSSLSATYNAGQEIVIEGFGLPEGVEGTTLELWGSDLKAGEPVQQIEPTESSHRRVVFQLPKGLEPGNWRVNVCRDGRSSNQMVLAIGQGKGPVSAAAVTAVRTRTEGGQHWLEVKGTGLEAEAGMMLRATFISPEKSVTLNFEPELSPWGTFQAQLEDEYIRDVTVIDVDLILGDTTHHHMGRVYAPGTPVYRVQFLEVECKDESDPENGSGWWPYADDEVVTTWLYAVDGAFYSKNTGMYSGFNDGDVQYYAYNDMFVIPMGGWFDDWQPIAEGILLSTSLYEWGTSDVHAAQGALDVVCTIVTYICPYPVVNVVISAVFDYLKDHIGEWFGSWGSPDFLGQCDEGWTAEELAALFEEGARSAGKAGGAAHGALPGLDEWAGGIDPDDLPPFERLKDYVNHYRQIDFDNSDDTGSYAIRYRISHRLSRPTIVTE